MTDVHVLVGGHNGRIALLRCRNLWTIPSPPPGHYRGTGGTLPAQYLVPADHGLLVGLYQLVDLLDEITLQFLFVLQPIVGFYFLAVRAFFPVALVALITTYMDVFGRKKRRYFPDHIVQKCIRRLFSGANGVVGGLASGGHLKIGIVLVVAEQVGVRGHKGLAMAGHIDLGYDFNVAHLGIGDYFLNVLLGIKTPYRFGFLGRGRLPLPPSYAGPIGPPGPFFGQVRVFLYFDSPALVVGQMPVECIHLIRRKHIDLLFDKFLRPKMSGNVKHNTAPSESGIVLYHHSG